ncbi:MAG: hypothetical protein MI725_13850 [Pirellulales bacterium]|nr:hypothetical protein [Pirellulales bacterium]
MPVRRSLAGLFAKSFLVVLLSWATEQPMHAQQLRIETDVYLGDQTESISHNVTLFESGAVYDFVEKPAQITVFRPPTTSRPGQFILLDLETKWRTEVSTARIEGLLKKLANWAAEQEDPMLRFSAQPNFEETFDETTGALLLKHPLWNYKVATVPAENKEKLARYREFADWYSRLNAMLHGAPPPGPRLQLNAALEKNGVVPVEIHRTMDSTSSPQLRATHLFSWRLSREDLSRLEEARQFLTSFEKVDNKAFLAELANKDVVRGQSR